MPRFGFWCGKSLGRYELEGSTSLELRKLGELLYMKSTTQHYIACTSNRHNRHNYMNFSVKPQFVGFSALLNSLRVCWKK